jgi:hypothetical protein
VGYSRALVTVSYPPSHNAALLLLATVPFVCKPEARSETLFVHITQLSTVLSEKLIVAQLLKIFPTIYRT